MTVSRNGSHAPAAASDRRLVTIALFVATFLVSLDTSVVSTAMPTVVSQIGGIDLYAWAFSSYLLTSTVTIPGVSRSSSRRRQSSWWLRPCAVRRRRCSS